MGSLYQRSDGMWAAAVLIDGRRVVRYSKSKAAAESKLADLERHAALGEAPPPNLTVAELIERWMTTEASRWKPRTVHEYRKVVERHVIPQIGATRLNRLGPDRLQRFFDGLSDRPRQANKVYRILHRCFVVGLRWGYLQTNPCERIIPPTYRAPRIVVPAVEDLVRFLDAIRDEPVWTWVVVAVATGLRPGEQAALRWSDVNVERRTVTVQRAGQWIDGEWVETEPKTASGMRTLALSDHALTALRRQMALVARRRLGDGAQWHDNDLVFPGAYGRPMWISSLPPILRRLCREHGLTKLTPHTLRHVHASLLLNEQVPLPLVSRRLGHANTHVTASIYSHAVANDECAARAIEDALGRGPNRQFFDDVPIDE